MDHSRRPDRDPVVLAVDPDPGVRQFLSFVFRLWGVRHLLAADGPGAVDLAGRHRAAVTVLLVDAGTPGVGRVRAAAPAARLLYLTADTHPSTVADLLDRGAAGVVAKPFHPAALLTAVTRAGVQPAGRSNRRPARAEHPN